jgi:hypothetical protein
MINKKKTLELRNTNQVNETQSRHSTDKTCTNNLDKLVYLVLYK